MTKIFASLGILLYLATISDSIRCYECRSDIQANCGDPFYTGNIAVKECNDFSAVDTTAMCFKASQYVAGTYITVRGCAPFDSQTFSVGMQRGMRGTYWKGLSSAFSLCDYPACNASNKMYATCTAVALLAYLMMPSTAL